MWASQVVPVVKNLPADGGDTEDAGFDLWVREGRTVHASILAWTIPWTEEPGGLQSMGLQSVGHD